MNKKALGAFSQKIQEWSTQSVNRQIFAAASIVGLSTLIVSLITFFKEILVAHRFGTGDNLEAFLIAFLLPSLAINVFAGSLNSAFIPTYVRVRETEGDKAAQDLLENVSAIFIVLLLIICLLIALLSPILFPLIASGFDSEKLQLSHLMFYYLLPLTVIKGLSTIWGAVLNTRDHFLLASIAPIAAPFITILFLLTLVGKLDIYVLILGLIAGFVIEAGLLGRAIKKKGLFNWPRWSGFDGATKKILQQYVPMLAGAFLTSSAVVVDQAMAAMLRPGGVAALNYGIKITSFVTGLGSMAIGTAILPYLSSMVAGNKLNEIKNTVGTYLKLIITITVPLTLLIVIFSVPLIEVVFQRGAFTYYDAQVVADVQKYYILQVPFYIGSIIITRVLSSLLLNNIILIVALFDLVLNILLNIFLSKYMGVAGIALSTSIVYCTSFLLVYIYLITNLYKRMRNSNTY